MWSNPVWIRFEQPSAHMIQLATILHPPLLIVMTVNCVFMQQVLSNADLRAKYDQHGVEGLDVNFMDSGEFFTMLFGSDRFEHLLGELSLAQLTRYAFACITQD